MGTARSMEIYQFKVMLIGITPPIWRRIQVPGGFSRAQLHHALQVAMGWEKHHLYMFRIGSKKYGPPDVDEVDNMGLIDAKRTRLCPVLPGVGLKFTMFTITATTGSTNCYWKRWSCATRPRCIHEVLPASGTAHRMMSEELEATLSTWEAMADPDHQEHEEMMMWRGPFDPGKFSVEKVNQKLAKKFRSKPKPGAQRTAIATP